MLPCLLFDCNRQIELSTPYLVFKAGACRSVQGFQNGSVRVKALGGKGGKKPLTWESNRNRVLLPHKTVASDWGVL
jgi:hypothetical protein